MDIKVLKVAKNSNINAVADAIYEQVINDGACHIDSIGISATYTLVKSLILVTDNLVSKGYQCNVRPYYVTVKVDGENERGDVKTAIRWTLVAKTR